MQHIHIEALDEAAAGHLRKFSWHHLRKVRVDKRWRFEKADIGTCTDSHKPQIREETAV
jgi:hypothetical protein